MENHFTPTINASELKPQTKYVLWIDTMGTRNTMAESLAKSANFVLKLHGVILNATNKYKATTTVYPVMDGAYITCTKKADITSVIKNIYRDLFNIFNEEQQFEKRFIIRGTLAYGEVIDGTSITDAVTTDIDEGYKKNMLLGIPIIQAYRSEKLSPPFGVFIHESARNFADDRKIQGKTFRWWNIDKGKIIGEAIISYFDWCKYMHPLLDMDVSKIEAYKDIVNAYFVPYDATGQP